MGLLDTSARRFTPPARRKAANATIASLDAIHGFRLTAESQSGSIRARALALAALAYAALIVYGSLYPLTGWTTEQVKVFAFLVPHWPDHIPRADFVTNVLAYMPLGVLLAHWFGRRSVPIGVILATLLCAVLS